MAVVRSTIAARLVLTLDGVAADPRDRKPLQALLVSVFQRTMCQADECCDGVVGVTRSEAHSLRAVAMRGSPSTRFRTHHFSPDCRQKAIPSEPSRSLVATRSAGVIERMR